MNTQQRKWKTQWINALKSGIYNQGYKKLFNPETDEYCSLGVLCDIVDPNNLYNWQEKNVIPDDLLKLTGLNCSIGSLKLFFKNHYTSLVSLNDENKYTFKEIADIIESPDTINLYK